MFNKNYWINEQDNANTVIETTNFMTVFAEFFFFLGKNTAGLENLTPELSLLIIY